MKQTANHGNDGRDMKFCSLTKLVLVTGSNKPLNIINEMWPPELKKQVGMDRKDIFMSEVIISLLDESVSALRQNGGLILSMMFSVIQGIVKKEEASSSIDEQLVISIRKVWWMDLHVKEPMDEVDLCILCYCIGCVQDDQIICNGVCGGASGIDICGMDGRLTNMKMRPQKVSKSTKWNKMIV